MACPNALWRNLHRASHGAVCTCSTLTVWLSELSEAWIGTIASPSSYASNRYPQASVIKEIRPQNILILSMKFNILTTNWRILIWWFIRTSLSSSGRLKQSLCSFWLCSLPAYWGCAWRLVARHIFHVWCWWKKASWGLSKVMSHSVTKGKSSYCRSWILHLHAPDLNPEHPKLSAENCCWIILFLHKYLLRILNWEKLVHSLSPVMTKFKL